MKMLDLFSGGGGFSLAAHWIGWETVAFCEKDRVCRLVLNKNFPGITIHEDIKKLNGLLMKMQLILFAEGSRAKISPLQERAHSTYRSGKKCLELYERLGQLGSLQRTFMASLLEGKEWLSKLCVLTWRPKVIKCSHRLLFQLVPKERRIEGIEYGLLPTPTVMDSNYNQEATDARRLKAKAKKINGNGFGLSLAEMLVKGLLPTPTHRDYRSGFSPESDAMKERLNHSRGVNLHEHIQRVIGHNFRLSHQFQLEMMGFPVTWNDIPEEVLINSGKSQSKSVVMQSHRKSHSKSSKQ